MGPHDRAAMQLALEMMRADPEQRVLLGNNQSEQEAALFAVGFLQVKNLRLKPWQCPPRDSSDGAASDCYGSRPAETELRQRMKRAGVSVYHPDPMSALAAAEAKPAA